MFSMIPLPYKLMAMASIVVGVFFFGYMKGTAYAEAELQRFAAKHAEQVAQLEKANTEISNNVQIQYVDRVQTIKEKEYVYVNAAENLVASKCDVSNGWVYVHDTGANGDHADPTRASDETSSGIADNQALSTVVGNYSTCNQTREQLIGLQNWIRENKAVIDQVNRQNKDK